MVFLTLLLLLSVQGQAGERAIVTLKDFSQTEVKAGGFELPSGGKIHIKALGAGKDKEFSFAKSDMYAYGWIINAETRMLVWKMNRDNTKRENDYRKCDDVLSLEKGKYEVYFAAYGMMAGSSFPGDTYNIDRRKNDLEYEKGKRRGWFEWIEKLFGQGVDKNWKRFAKDWGMELFVDDQVRDVAMFAAPLDFPRVVFKAIRLGENEHIRQQFVLARPLTVRVYALGELDYSGHPADYGWIVNVKTRRRVWEMKRDNLRYAGGAEKNVRCDETISLPAGEFTLYYNTDDSHSFLDWNAQPPIDPLRYGVTLTAVNDSDMSDFKLTSGLSEEKNIIVSLVRVRDSESRNESFTLKSESKLRVYAIGEQSLARRQLADYGWIINAKTRQKVWMMDADRTLSAGGDEKNRLVDEIITLPAGDYSVYYQTDDSHAFDDWNATPPFDPERWGITISGEGDGFDMANVDKNPSSKISGIVAQLVRVKDGARKSQQFSIQKTERLRVYAIGEGMNREMYDYGWIENTQTGHVVWEMTYSMTFHAGGGRKNRLVNTTILLDKGDYTLHYVSDDSHSYNNWNADPPDDPTMWGITLSLDQP